LTRAGYYSPLWIGALIAAVMLWQNPLLVNRFPTPGAYWGAYIVCCVVGGLISQLIMLGSQGAFAQVLPVPGGRSLRGKSATVSGVSLLAAVGLLGAAGFFYVERSTGMATVAPWFAVGGAAALVVSVTAYFWGLPTAVADFGGRD
jgi:hypothetical protein